MLKYRVDLTESLALQNILLKACNPYHDYYAFKDYIGRLINDGNVPQNLYSFLVKTKNINQIKEPFIFIEGLPVDPVLPIFDNKNPVEQKRITKTTFVTEGVLELFAQIRNENPIGYLNVNQGDVFQDIFPMQELFYSQSQKALHDIYFHKDLANHFVRPDWVNIFCIRNDVDNMIATCFVKNYDILQQFDAEEKQELAKAQFHTPYDDLSTYKSLVELGEASLHPILTSTDGVDIRFFENRTTATTDVGRALVKKLTQLLHQHKICIHLRAGDLIASQNNYSIHCKQVIAINDVEVAKQRWMMKTVNVDSYDRISKYTAESKGYLVNG